MSLPFPGMGDAQISKFPRFHPLEMTNGGVGLVGRSFIHSIRQRREQVKAENIVIKA
jgi:hypothetical protein